jgi:hypothetical protein
MTPNKKKSSNLFCLGIGWLHRFTATYRQTVTMKNAIRFLHCCLLNLLQIIQHMQRNSLSLIIIGRLVDRLITWYKTCSQTKYGNNQQTSVESGEMLTGLSLTCNYKWMPGLACLGRKPGQDIKFFHQLFCSAVQWFIVTGQSNSKDLPWPNTKRAAC